MVRQSMYYIVTSLLMQLNSHKFAVTLPLKIKIKSNFHHIHATANRSPYKLLKKQDITRTSSFE